MIENPNIPEAVRAVAADGTQLRYALMEMAREMDDIITLGRGDPDLPTPPHIVAAATRAMRDGLTGATDIKGMPPLREAIAAHMRAHNGLALDSDNVMVTTGGQEGLFLAVQAVIKPGDEILVPDPRYSSYDDAIKRAGGRMVMLPTNRDDAFNLEAEAVEAAITPASKALLIVTPSNPTAGIVTEDRLRAIAAVAIRHNLIVIVDEIYGKVVYPPWRHFSIGSLPGMAERTITLGCLLQSLRHDRLALRLRGRAGGCHRCDGADQAGDHGSGRHHFAVGGLGGHDWTARLCPRVSRYLH